MPNGVSLNERLSQKVYNWTLDDIRLLFEGFDMNRKTGPTNGYAIFLFSIMDIWGSIFLNAFGDESSGHSKRNIREFLSRLVVLKLSEYPITDSAGNIDHNIVSELRHNLVHNYGLRVIESRVAREYLNVDVDGNQPTINIQSTNSRWHIDCFKLKEDITLVITDWMKNQGYLA